MVLHHSAIKLIWDYDLNVICVTHHISPPCIHFTLVSLFIRCWMSVRIYMRPTSVTLPWEAQWRRTGAWARTSWQSALRTRTRAATAPWDTPLEEAAESALSPSMKTQVRHKNRCWALFMSSDNSIQYSDLLGARLHQWRKLISQHQLKSDYFYDNVTVRQTQVTHLLVRSVRINKSLKSPFLTYRDADLNIYYSYM